MITSIYSDFASVNSISTLLCVFYFFFFNFYLYINLLWKNALVSTLGERERILLPYNRAVTCKYARFIYNLIIIVFPFLSLLLQGYLSLPPTHTHYNSLLDSSTLITVLSSESIMSAYREVSRLSWLPPFFSSLAIPHIRLLVQKLRQIFPFTLFSFFFLFYTLSFYRYRCYFSEITMQHMKAR